MNDNLLLRLDSEAGSVSEGSHQYCLCTDAADCIRSLQKMVKGGDAGRKGMTYDLENQNRLISDIEEARKLATDLVTELQEENAMYKEDNDVLRAALQAHGEEAAKPPAQ